MKTESKTVWSGKTTNLYTLYASSEPVVLQTLISYQSRHGKGRINCVCSQKLQKQDCIPVGCVPPACWPYLPVFSGGGCLVQRGVSDLGGVWSRRGVYLVQGGPGPGGSDPGGCTWSGGMSGLGGVPGHWGVCSGGVLGPGGYLVWGGVPGPGGCLVQGVYLVQGLYLVLGGVPAQVLPLWTEFLTHAYQNITFK